MLHDRNFAIDIDLLERSQTFGGHQIDFKPRILRHNQIQVIGRCEIACKTRTFTPDIFRKRLKRAPNTHKPHNLLIDMYAKKVNLTGYAGRYRRRLLGRNNVMVRHGCRMAVTPGVESLRGWFC